MPMTRPNPVPDPSAPSFSANGWQAQIAARVVYACAAGLDDVFLVSAPWGTGKTELGRHLCELLPDGILVSEPAPGWLREVEAGTAAHGGLVIADGTELEAVRTLVAHHRGPLLVLRSEGSATLRRLARKRSDRRRHYIQVDVLDEPEAPAMPRPATIATWWQCGPNEQPARQLAAAAPKVRAR